MPWVALMWVASPGATLAQDPAAGDLTQTVDRRSGWNLYSFYFDPIVSNDIETFFEPLLSNVEGELIDKIQEVGFSYDGILLNAGGYTHTSVAISDAIAAIETPVVEVHISNIFAREEFRHISLLSKNCVGIISGFGLSSYQMGLDSMLGSK